MVREENLETLQARVMYDSYHFVVFENLARPGHWMFSLGYMALVKE